MINAGCMQDSNMPSRNRTTIKDLKSLAAAEQAMTMPHRKTLAATYFATGSFCSRRLVGYSPTSTPMYNIVPSQLRSRLDLGCTPLVNRVEENKPIILANEVSIILDTHNRGEAKGAFV